MRSLPLGLALASMACSAGVAGPIGPTTGPRPRTDESGAYQLELLTPREMTLSRAMSVALRVRYLDDQGQPASGPVYFDLAGEGGGARLQAAAVETDEDGVAEVEVRAGSADAAFEIVATADYAEEVRAALTVTQDGAGDLRVVSRYDGDRRVYGADVYLYTDTPCEAIDPAAPPPADRLQSTASLRDDVLFGALETGSHWSALVLAIGETGAPVLVGCASAAEIAGGTETVVEVPLAELPVVFEGPFSLESHFAIADSLTPDARSALDVLSEIADDPNDPATYLLDLLGDQIDNDVLRYAYLGARAIFGLDQAINDIIFDWMPDFVWDALQAGSDLASVLEDAQVDSVLTVSPLADAPDGAGTREARHELVDLVLELDGVTHRFSIADDVGVRDASVLHVPLVLAGDDELHIGAHDFRIGLGTLAIFAMNEVVLPRFDGSPDSLAEFVSGAMPCDWIGDELASWVGVGDDSTWAGICEIGAGMMGQYVESRVRDLDDSFDTLSLEGTAKITDETKDLSVDTFEDGVWNAALTGPAGRAPVAGTFTGQAAERQGSNR